MDAKEQEEHFLVKNKHRTLNGGQKRISLGGAKEKEARKVFRKVENHLSDSGFSHLPTRKGCRQ